MKRNVLITGLIIAVAAGLYLCVGGVSGSSGKDKSLLRVGVYDSRAVAIAYTASPHNDNTMVEKSKAKKKAEQAGDHGRTPGGGVPCGGRARKRASRS